MKGYLLGKFSLSIATKKHEKMTFAPGSFILICIIQFCVPAYAQSKSDFKVVKTLWTDSILIDNKYAYANQLKDSTSLDEPYIWIKLECNEKFLDQLDSTKSIPFRFKWISPGLLSETEIRKPKSEIGASQNTDQVLANYRQSVDDNGFFELIIWSNLESEMNSGKWKVRFLKETNKPVKYPNKKNCVFEIIKIKDNE